MRVLYVNLDFPPASGPGIWRALAMAKYLPAHGVDLTVLASDRSPSRRRFDESLLADLPPSVTVRHLSSVFQNDVVGGFGRVRDLVPGRRPKALVERFERRFVAYWPDQQFHWATRVAAEIVRHRHAADVLLTSGPPHVAHLAALMARPVAPLPWVMDYRDLWSSDRVQIKQYRYQPRLFAQVEREALGRADAVVAVSPGYIDHLADRFADVIPRDRFHLIRNGHDIPKPLLARADERPRNKQAHFHFNGTPQRTHPFGALLDVMVRWRAEHGPEGLPKITFTGLPDGFAERIAAEGMSAHVYDVGHMPRDASVEFCLGCDVLVCMVNDANPLYRGTIPGKAYEALGLGRHLFAIQPKGSVVGELIDDADNGTLVDVGDPDDVYRGFSRIMDLFAKGALHDQSPEARARIADRYSRERQAAQLAEVLRSVARPR